MSGERMLELIRLVDEVNQMDSKYSWFEHDKYGNSMNVLWVGSTPTRAQSFHEEASGLVKNGSIFNDTDLKQGEAFMRRLLAGEE